MKSVVVFDMDGTLLDSDSNVIGGQETLDLLSELQARGAELCICTGRLDHDIVRAAQKFNLSFANRVSQHGAVTITHNRLQAELINKCDAHAILHKLEETPDIRIELNTVSNRYWHTERDPDFPKELYDSHIIRSDFAELIDCQPVVLFLVIGAKEVLETLASFVNENFGDTQAILSSNTSLEIMAKGISKGRAIEHLYKGYDIYAIGDAPNDFEMLDLAKRGYLVSDIACDHDVIYKPSIVEALEDIASHIE